MKSIFTFFVLLIFSSIIIAQEAVIYHVVPSDYTSTPGTAAFTSQLSSTPRTYQLLIHESLLAPLLNEQLLAVS